MHIWKLVRKVDTKCENVPQRGKKDIWWFPVKDTSVSDWGMGEGESAAGDICLSEKHFTLPPQRTPQSEVCMAQQMSLREHRTTLRELVLLHTVGEVWHSHSTALFQFTTHTNALREAFKRKNLKLGFYHNKRRGVLNNFCKAIVVIRSDCCEHPWAIFFEGFERYVHDIEPISRDVHNIQYFSRA